MTAQKFYKRAIITAEQFDGSQEMIDKYELRDKRTQWPQLVIHTLEGDMEVDNDDWIATGVEGEHWPIDDDIFRKTYAPVPAVPQDVWNYIGRCIYGKKGLAEASGILWLNYFENSSEDTSPLANWYVTGHNADDFARAYLAWPNVEIEEEDK